MSMFSELDIDIQSRDAFPPDTLALVAPAQADPVYLAAIDELCKVEGFTNTYIVAKYLAKLHRKTLGVVIHDAVEQSAAYGSVFAS